MAMPLKLAMEKKVICRLKLKLLTMSVCRL